MTDHYLEASQVSLGHPQYFWASACLIDGRKRMESVHMRVGILTDTCSSIDISTS